MNYQNLIFLRWNTFATALTITLSLTTFFSAYNVVHAQNEDNNRICENDPEGTELMQAAAESFWSDTNFCQNTVDFREFFSGGVGPDGIPPIDNPTFQSIEQASEWLSDQSPVIAVQINSEARAYPLAMMTRHEIVNDEFDDVAVVVTFCPLCNSALVYNREVNGEILRFGVSGLLRNSDLIMWDDDTKSWWQQLTGEALVGAYAGTQLEMFPSQVVGFSAFAAQFPEGSVLDPMSGIGGGYGRNPYLNYDSSEKPFLFAGEIDDRLPATERVLAGIIGGEPIAYPFSVLEVEQVVNDFIGGRDIVAFWQPGSLSALDQAQIDESRDVGMAALFRRELDDRILTFGLDSDGNIVDEETGSLWNVFGTAISGELQGSQLRQELAAPHFWFAWAAFKPETMVYGLD